MAEIPKTSVSLLTALAQDTANARWSEFYKAYEGPMRAFLASQYPMLEADDIIQDTMVALVKRLPTYHYTPDERGHFHNYLIGILNHKAADAVRRYKKQKRITEAAQAAALAAASVQEPPPFKEDEEWANAAREAAIDQLMADDSLAPNTRMIFEHVVLLHEPPEAVAAKFGTNRNNVDQIKTRLTSRLSKIIEAMTQEGD